jgi:hypothetical protein
MTKLCEKCGKGEAVVNLNTASRVDDGEPGPDLWIAADLIAEDLGQQAAPDLDPRPVGVLAFGSRRALGEPVSV